jgi:hypothetical protein
MVSLEGLSLLVKNERPDILHDTDLISIGFSGKMDQLSLTSVVAAEKRSVYSKKVVWC